MHAIAVSLYVRGENYMKRSSSITAYHLKWIALLTMTYDHLFKLFQIDILAMLQTMLAASEYDYEPYYAMYLLLGIGRLSFPIYAFLVAQGCHHTHNLRAYILRLGAFALLSELPFQLLIAELNEVPVSFHLALGNIFVTLCLGAMTCGLFEAGKRSTLAPWVSWILIAMLVWLGALLDCDYGPFGILLILVCYISKTKKQLALGFILALTGMTLFYQSWPLEDWVYDLSTQGILLLASISVLYWLLRYQGEQGKRFGYAIYAYYPVHLLVLIGLYHLLH